MTAFNFPSSPTYGQVYQSYTWDDEKWCSTVGGIAGVSTKVSQFLARTSGLNATHINAYTALIDGLAADGIWAKLDVLHIYATQDATTALLNLVSTSYNGIAFNSPNFVVDRGYNGGQGTTIYIDTQFTPSTAPSAKLTRNSAHLSLWNLTNGLTNGAIVGTVDGGGVNTLALLPRYNDGNFYYNVNGGQAGGTANSDSRGFLLINRSTSAAVEAYINAVSFHTSSSNNSTGLPARSLQTLGLFNSSGQHFGQGSQEAAFSLGSSLNSTEVTAFYNRMRTYMTAVGVP